MKRILLPALICVFALAGAAMAADGPIVDTPKGKVQGFVKDGVDVFLGVPEALPPYEADTRLRGPQPVKAWEGIVECTEQASVPIQPDRSTTGNRDASQKFGYKGGGDCLRVNIWAPSGQREKLPVLAWIPGGGSVNCDTGANDGSAFARDGIIMVALPYRPNVDGFLKIEGADANIAIRDMIFGLQWIKDNIASFGGDPDNVTVMGQSAGATHIASIIASPLGKGLFKKAILMSPSAMAQWNPQQAEIAAQELGKFYNVPVTREGIMSVPLGDLMGFSTLAAQKLTDKEWLAMANGNGTLFKPYVDGEVLVKRPVEAVAEGVSNGIDVLMGCTANEWNAYIVPNGVIDKMGKAEIKEILDAIGAPASVEDEYRKNGRGQTDGEIFAALESDVIFRVPTNRLLEARAAGGGKTWAYSFDERHDTFDGKIGAAHGSDLPFVFKTLNDPAKQRLVGPNASQALADKMHASWVDFIKTGNPGWNQYDAEKRNIMSISSGNWEEKSDPWNKERQLINLK